LSSGNTSVDKSHAPRLCSLRSCRMCDTCSTSDTRIVSSMTILAWWNEQCLLWAGHPDTWQSLLQYAASAHWHHLILAQRPQTQQWWKS
jgi:hypothetical protein